MANPRWRSQPEPQRQVPSTGTGGGMLDDIGVTVNDAYFESTQFGSRLVLRVDAIDAAGLRTYDYDVRLSCGRDMVVMDKDPLSGFGKRVLHNTGDENQVYNPGTNLAKFIDSCLDVGVPLEDRGDPLEAAPWIGLQMHLKLQERRLENPQEGQRDTYRAYICTAYKGSTTVSGGASEPVGAAAAGSNGQGAEGLEGKDLAAFNEAKSADDFWAWFGTRTSADGYHPKDPRIQMEGTESLWVRAGRQPIA